VQEPIRFRTTTASSLLKLAPRERQRKLSQLCISNAESVLAALRFCLRNSIGCFRIPSCVLPIKTHPELGYDVTDLPESAKIISKFRQCGQFAAKHGLRTTFHPDQFVVLNSPSRDIVAKSIADLEYQAVVAEWVGADVINIHTGGAYGDKAAALMRFARNLDRLSNAVRSRLTIENDDTVFSPSDLLPLCCSADLPLVYDVHHHRCFPDGLSIEAATSAALRTWNREPLFHISSPRAGWNCRLPRPHHDYIDPRDFPNCWIDLAATIEVEAKAKELAVLELQNEISAVACRARKRLRRAPHRVTTGSAR
jgi:UV DNA damage endonuclease